MKKTIFLLILFAFLFALPAFAQDELASIDGGIGITLHIESLTYQEAAGRFTPSNGIYLVMLMTIENTGDDDHCVFARDIRLLYDGEEYAPERALMSAVQGELPTRRDYVGPITGQCVDPGQSVPSFVAFDVPAGMGSFIITYMDEPQTFTDLDPVDSPAAPTLQPTARSSARPTATPLAAHSDTADAAALMDGIALLAGGRDVLSVQVADGRAKGGERNAIIAYVAHETEESAVIDELLDILRAAAATIRADDLDLDSISVIVGQTEEKVLGIIVTQVDDLLDYHQGRITKEAYLSLLEFTAL